MRDMLNLEKFLEVQQATILRKIIKLFKETVYENKLLPQAKKILRDAKRRESETERMKYKLEGEVNSLKEQARRQLAVIQTLEDLQVDHADLRKAYDSLINENNRLKLQYGVKNLGPEMA